MTRKPDDAMATASRLGQSEQEVLDRPDALPWSGLGRVAWWPVPLRHRRRSTD